MGYKQIEWHVGVDEAGRGPLAGPVAVGLAKIPVAFDWNILPGVGDSKALSAKKRLAIFERTKQLKEQNQLDFVVVFGSAHEIDEKGIAVVIRECITFGLQQLRVLADEVFIKLDGSLQAPTTYAQETIIKGDSKELVIGLASICAKETRDAYMREIALQFPAYDFATHKGYGTKSHRKKINEYGLSPEHRVSYCKQRGTWATV